jgi:hypothetical protein
VVGKEDGRGEEEEEEEEEGILNLGGKAPSFLNLKKVAPIHFRTVDRIVHTTRECPIWVICIFLQGICPFVYPKFI